MKSNFTTAASILLSVIFLTVSCATQVKGDEKLIEKTSNKELKSTSNNNPISAYKFWADPTAVEYEGRLYVYGTNDNQQCNETTSDTDNKYDKIKSFVVYSTADMVNWTYHGEINVEKTAPWIVNSWAPSIVSRVEEDGLTHFYLYFSNNGMGVGVITATNPLGPWSDPLGRPFISTETKRLYDCPNPFDPGVVIDDNGDAYLSFGGGKANGAPKEMPGTARIIKLGKDMISFDSNFIEIPAPYFFEASELNYINGTYVYTYNSDWNDHQQNWNYKCSAPSQCSQVYMTNSKNPLRSSNWKMNGEYLANPGNAGQNMEYSNNHSHLQKFKGKWYILYHNLELKAAKKIKGGYRSICVEDINVDEENIVIQKKSPSRKGALPADVLNPYVSHSGAEVWNNAEIIFDATDSAFPYATSTTSGSWTAVSNVLFTGNTKNFNATVKSKGIIEVRVDSKNGNVLASIEFDSSDFTTVSTSDLVSVSKTHSLYFVFSDSNISLKDWSFDK